MTGNVDSAISGAIFQAVSSPMSQYRKTLPAYILAKLLYSSPEPWSNYSARKLPGKTETNYAAIYAAVNDGSGFWYDSNGDPVARLVSEILSDGQTNQWLIWCSNGGRLMIFNNTLTDAELVKVRVYIGLGIEEFPPDGYSWVIFNGRRVVFNNSYEIAKVGQ